jgi:hypothetical protein
MVDTTKQYLFYNVYGDADDLIANKPSNVILVPFGWDEETENNRNSILEELGRSVSCLPSLLFFGKEYIAYGENDVERVESARWEEVRIGTLVKPWNWDDINTCIEEFMNNPEKGVPSGFFY